MSSETSITPIPRASSDAIDSLYFSPIRNDSPKKTVRKALVLSSVMFFAGDVNAGARAIRSAANLVWDVFTFNKDYLIYCRYLKVVASFRGVMKIQKIFSSLNDVMSIKATRPARILACWHFLKYSKTFVRSIAWFATLISDFGWIAPQRVEWARFVDRVHFPFQAITTSIAFINLCKVSLILLELNMYRSDVKLASGYMADYHNKLVHDLQIPPKEKLGKKVTYISRLVKDANHIDHAQAKEKCNEVVDQLIKIAKKRFILELLNTSAKVLSLSSTILDTTKPLPFLPASLLSLTITALKTIKYWKNRPEIVYTKTP